MGSATTPSTVSTATMPTSMTDAEATRLGLKVYVHGGSYVSGLAPTITLTGGGGSLSSVQYSKFIPYQTQDGNWFLRFSLDVYLSSLARTGMALTVNGVTAISGGFPSCTGWTNGAGATISRVFFSGSTLNMSYGNATTDEHILSGDIPLNAKPSWAY